LQLTSDAAGNMEHEFATLEKAYEAGYRDVSHRYDRDVSGPYTRGKKFMDKYSRETVQVWLTDVMSKRGSYGVSRPMYPPR